MSMNEIKLNLTCKLVFRLINLFFNGLIIRNINLNVIGIANIQLELIYSTILFFTRESLRRNVPKIHNIHSIYHYINLIWLIIPLGFVFIFFCLLFTLLFLQTINDENIVLYYREACFIYAFAAFIELLSEPFYLLATVTRNYSINIYIEFFASILGFGIQTIFVIKNSKSALLFYGFGYLIYSSLSTLSYYFYFLIHKKEKRRHLFVISSFNELSIKFTSPFVDHKLFNETMKYFKRGISIKILTEGEKYLIALFSLISFKEQAIFHMIYLLGSIFPRFIFSTIEQIALNYFQRTFTSIKTDPTSKTNNEYIQDDQSPYSNNYQLSTPTEERTIKLNALTLLNNLIRLLIVISILLITFVIPYSSGIIEIYVGRNLSINSSLVYYLHLYLINIFLNGLNGINETYLQSIMSIKELNNYQNILLIYSFVYLILCYLFIPLFRITGIIIFNCLNLIGRIIINNYLINRYSIRIESRKFYLFSSHYILTLFMSIILAKLSQNLIENSYGQISFSIGLILTILCLTLKEEKEMIHYIYCVYKLNYQNKRSIFSKRH